MMIDEHETQGAARVEVIMITVVMTAARFVRCRFCFEVVNYAV